MYNVKESNLGFEVDWLYMYGGKGAAVRQMSDNSFLYPERTGHWATYSYIGIITIYLTIESKAMRNKPKWRLTV